MVEQPMGCVTHRANHRHLVVDLGESRQQLGEMNSRNLGRNAIEDALDVIGNIFLRIPQIDMTRPTLQVEHDDAIGLGPTGSALDHFSGDGLHLEHGSQRQAKESRTTDAHQIASGHHPRITEI